LSTVEPLNHVYPLVPSASITLICESIFRKRGGFTITKKITLKRPELEALDWEGIIDNAIRRKDWFSGFTNCVTYFEHWGYWKLKWYCIKNKINAERKLHSLSVGNIAVVLYLLRAIDQDTYSKMLEVIKERHRLVHPAREGITYRDRKEEETFARLLNDAKDCIRRIKKGIGH